ncbi:zf-RVT domain-containing protein [Cephalotus follicularis]|uniref:Zf-RVT domain-containing protein n=1 Tax=Cephalotus follicularis TaxID=3775 RepID=A0A1Q3CTK3_CEPFO|nr:zf-RVT domain-containing protein [Cephalotus follicularis]
MIRSGNSSFWKENWLGRPLWFLACPLLALTVKEALDIPPLLDVLLDHPQKEVAKSIKLIEGQDKLIFSLAPSSIFSSSLFYEEKRHKANAFSWVKYIWNSFIPTTIAFFIWKTIFNGISVDQNIQRRGIPLASKCRCCLNSNVETLEHLLFQGDVAVNIWGNFSKALNLTP